MRRQGRPVPVPADDAFAFQLVEQTGPRYYYSNLRVDYDPAQSGGRTITSMRLSDGAQLRDDGSYTLATIDYLADGGDALTLLTTLPRTVLGVTVVDALADHLRTMAPPQ